MDWEVSGANKKTGEDATVIVQGETAEDAARAASERGLYVSRTKPIMAAVQRVERGPEKAHRSAGRRPEAPSLNINTPRRGSSMGVAAMVLGVVALLFCWVPFIGLFSLPLSGIGLLLAVIGLFTALGRRGSGLGFIIAGGTLSGLALLIGGVVGFISIGAVEAANQAVVEFREQQAASAPIPIPRDDSGAETTAEAEIADEWINASTDGAQTPLASVTVVSAKVAVAQYPNPYSARSMMETKSPVLQLRVVVENTSEGKKIDFATWRLRSSFDERASLTDGAGNTYRMVSDDDMRVGEAVNFASLYPGETATDTLLFERPVSADSELFLTLEARWEEGGSKLRFRIPARMIER
jgi:hypothetical protein